MGVKLQFFYIEERTCAEGVWEKDAEEDIWIYDGRDNMVLEKTAYWAASWFMLLAEYCGD